MKKPAPPKKKAPSKEPKAKAASLGPFDFLNSINAGLRGHNLLENARADTSESGLDQSSPDKAYVPFIINRGLSYDADTVLIANEMNLHASLPAKMQYDFLRGVVSPRKRWSKWLKRLDDGPDVALIKKAYSYSTEKAREALALFTPEALNELRARFDTGGASK